MTKILKQEDEKTQKKEVFPFTMEDFLKALQKVSKKQVASKKQKIKPLHEKETKKTSE